LIASIGLTFDFGDSNQALVIGDFGSLSEELYNLGEHTGIKYKT
jgi:hypothetical protein